MSVNRPAWVSPNATTVACLIDTSGGAEIQLSVRLARNERHIGCNLPAQLAALLELTSEAYATMVAAAVMERVANFRVVRLEVALGSL
jgi:mannose/fructose-specific phosphotransferase system component IIA